MTSSRDLPRSLRLHDDERSLLWAADDWGHITHRRPRAVLRPDTVGEVAAAARRFPLVPRGQGHSLAGEAQAEDGVVVDMSGLDALHEVRGDRVIVDAGVRWSQVLRTTLQHGLTPPVLTDYLELSVGGTLSVGGIGGTSHRYGLQTDNVLELEVVTPDGELRTCSPSHNPALFDNVRGGHGEHGCIVRATLRLIPAHTHTRRQKLHYGNIATFLADQRRLVGDGRFHYLEGQAQLDEAGNWGYFIEAASFHSVANLDTARLLGDLEHGAVEFEELTHHEFLNRMAAQESELRDMGAWYHPHPWIDLFLPDSAADEIITDTMRGLSADEVGDTGVVLIYPFQASRISTRRCPLPTEPVAFLFALLRTAPPDDPTAVQRMLDGNRELQERTIARGGTVYLSHW